MDRAMAGIKITELRRNLPSYVAEVRKGREIEVTSRGKVIARIVPAPDQRAAARGRLLELRKKCRIGDVISPGSERMCVQMEIHQVAEGTAIARPRPGSN